MVLLLSSEGDPGQKALTLDQRRRQEYWGRGAAVFGGGDGSWCAHEVIRSRFCSLPISEQRFFSCAPLFLHFEFTQFKVNSNFVSKLCLPWPLCYLSISLSPTLSLCLFIFIFFIFFGYKWYISSVFESARVRYGRGLSEVWLRVGSAWVGLF